MLGHLGSLPKQQQDHAQRRLLGQGDRVPPTRPPGRFLPESVQLGGELHVKKRNRDWPVQPGLPFVSHDHLHFSTACAGREQGSREGGPSVLDTSRSMPSRSAVAASVGRLLYFCPS